DGGRGPRERRALPLDASRGPADRGAARLREGRSSRPDRDRDARLHRHQAHAARQHRRAGRPPRLLPGADDPRRAARRPGRTEREPVTRAILALVLAAGAACGIVGWAMQVAGGEGSVLAMLLPLVSVALLGAALLALRPGGRLRASG